MRRAERAHRLPHQLGSWAGGEQTRESPCLPSSRTSKRKLSSHPHTCARVHTHERHTHTPHSFLEFRASAFPGGIKGDNAGRSDNFEQSRCCSCQDLSRSGSAFLVSITFHHSPGPVLSLAASTGGALGLPSAHIQGREAAGARAQLSRPQFPFAQSPPCPPGCEKLPPRSDTNASASMLVKCP